MSGLMFWKKKKKSKDQLRSSIESEKIPELEENSGSDKNQYRLTVVSSDRSEASDHDRDQDKDRQSKPAGLQTPEYKRSFTKTSTEETNPHFGHRGTQASKASTGYHSDTSGNHHAFTIRYFADSNLGDSHRKYTQAIAQLSTAGQFKVERVARQDLDEEMDKHGVFFLPTLIVESLDGKEVLRVFGRNEDISRQVRRACEV